MSKENIMKSNEQMFEDYGKGAITFHFIELWILLSTISILLFLALEVQSVISLFALPVLMFLFIFSMFKVGDIVDILKMEEKK